VEQEPSPGSLFGIIIAGYEHRRALSALQAKIDAISNEINANQAKIHSMKRIDNIKGPSDQQK
jgi:hypothetical protein